MRTYRAAFSQSTADNHRRQARAYLLFMSAYNYDHMAPSILSSLMYIQCLVNSFKNMTSVRNYVSGARTYLAMVGGDPTALSSPLVATLLRGATRLSAHVPCPAPPIPRTQLIRLCAGLRRLGGDGRVAMAAVLFGVATFLRQCNYLPATLGREGPHLIRRGHVRAHGPSLLVLVESTKTRHRADGPVSLLISPAPGSLYCPVAACSWAWRAVPAGPGSPLFLLPSSGRPLTSAGLVALIRATLTALGEPGAADVTIHSLRRTGALLASAGGAPDAEVMAHGTWTSGAYRAYVPAPASSTVPRVLAKVWA